MKVGERSVITFSKYKRAVTLSCVSASSGDSSQSFPTPLALLIPSIQPHHYGNWLDVSPSAPNLCHPAASDTEAMKPCLMATGLHSGSRFLEGAGHSVSLFWKKGQTPWLQCGLAGARSLFSDSCYLSRAFAFPAANLHEYLSWL